MTQNQLKAGKDKTTDDTTRQSSSNVDKTHHFYYLFKLRFKLYVVNVYTLGQITSSLFSFNVTIYHNFWHQISNPVIMLSASNKHVMFNFIFNSDDFNSGQVTVWKGKPKENVKSERKKILLFTSYVFCFFLWTWKSNIACFRQKERSDMSERCIKPSWSHRHEYR